MKSKGSYWIYPRCELTVEDDNWRREDKER